MSPTPIPTPTIMHMLARQTDAAGVASSLSSVISSASAGASSISSASGTATSSGVTSINSASSASAAMSTLSQLVSSAKAALASESRIAAGNSASNPAWFKYVGLAMAIASGLFIGSSFVLKKKGLLAAQKKYETTAGEGMQYLKSFMWWSGMIIMILGEVFNLVAYSFTDAILVTPMGALSVVVCAILSSFFLKEKLSLFGWLGCTLCILGSTIIALNGPDQHASGQIEEFKHLFLAPGFLVWTGICIATALGLIFFVVPKYGKKNMLVHISICSVIGGLSVSVTSGLGSAILLSIQGKNQFKNWFIYFLFAFVIVTLLTEIVYLNKALELFNTAMVTPTYYVLFTFMTLVTSIILFQGLAASVVGIITIVLGFLVICIGITILQLSKIDPEDLAKKPGIDRSTTMLLKASRSHISHSEKNDDIATLTTQIEEPGVDTVRGGLGIVGSVIRARSSRRLSRRFNSSADEYRRAAGEDEEMGALRVDPSVERYRLHDAPAPRSPLSPGIRTMPVPGANAGKRRISWAENADGHDREKRSPILGEGQSLSSFGVGGNAMLPPPTSMDLTSDSLVVDASKPSTDMSYSAEESFEEAVQRRRYHTEPRNGLLPTLHGIREASHESAQSPASVSATSAKYIDPYARYPPSSEGAGSIRPVGPRLPSSDNIRTMWDLKPIQSIDSPPAVDDDSVSAGFPATPSTATTPQKSDKAYPRASAGKDSAGEDRELLAPGGNDSEDEEERVKTGVTGPSGSAPANKRGGLFGFL